MLDRNAQSAAEQGLMAAIRAERESHSPPPREAAPESADAEASGQDAPGEAPEATQAAPEAQDAPEATEAAETPQESESEAPEGAEEEVEEIQLSALADLIKYVGGEEASAYELTVPVTVNGKNVNVPVGELKDSFRAKAEAERFQSEAKAMREQAEAQAQELRSQYESRLAEGAALVEALEKQALERFQGVKWDELKTEDPGAWSAARVELETTRNQINQVKAAVNQKISEYKETAKQQQDAVYQEHLQKEQAALYQAWPELADESKGATERTALIDELKSRGFTEQEIGNAADHRILLLARDAMRGRKSQESSQVAKKKVVKIAKRVISPGSAQSKADRGQDSVRRAAADLKKSGHHKDFARWLGEVRRNS